MDGVVELKGVTIVAATNRPDMIDKVGHLLSQHDWCVTIYPYLIDGAGHQLSQHNF